MPAEVTRENVIAAIKAVDVEGSVRENAKDWPGLDAEKVEDLIHWFGKYQSKLLGQVQTYDDALELPTVLAINYIEIKAVWLGLNTTMNYRIFRGEEADPVEQWKATGLSGILDAIEPFIGQDDLNSISSYLYRADVRDKAA